MIWLLPVSYFYNLPVLKYSLRGNNELRLYDLLGLLVLFFYIKYFNFINFKINKIIFFRRFNYFIIYCSISIILTLLFTIFYKDRIIVFVQSVLYLYHMWVFYLGSVFFYLYLISHNSYKKILLFIIRLILIESIIVIFQNLGIIPFLFNDAYKKSYFGFLSGTVGPNKIVIGMMMLISFSLIIAVWFENRLKISKALLLVTLSGTVISILLSGSRTTYVGLIVFLAYFFIKKTGKFIKLGIVTGVVAFFTIMVSPQLTERITDVFTGRVIDKIKNPEELKNGGEYAELYDDLGAGRNELQLKYVNLFIKHPYIMPFGVGFNNLLISKNSAHNIYLSLINEVGLVGLYFYVSWLFSYLLILKRKFSFLQLSLNGLVLSMMVTLFFGEHLYIYRPLFAILGYFMLICVILLVPQRRSINEK